MSIAQKFSSYTAFILLAIMVMSFALAPFTVKATVPVIDPVAIGKLALQLGELIKEVAESVFQSAQLYSLVLKEYVLDPAVKLLASIMLQALTKSIIEWIQGGGNTNFVSNLQAALTRAADEAAGEFLNMLAGTNLCSPFANPLRGIFRVPSVNLSQRISCTATDIFKNLQTSYEEFLNDFRRGGWIAYETTFYGGNNYIDALINAYDAKLVAESQRVSVLRTQYQAGSGFLGVRIKKQDCSQALPDNTDSEGNLICPTVDIQTTPGRLVADQLSKVFGSGIDQAVNADELSEAIDAVISALINKLISSAMAGLQNNDEYSGLLSPGLGTPAQLPQLEADLSVSVAPTPTLKDIRAGETTTFRGEIINQGGTTAENFNVVFKIDLNNDGTIDETLTPPTLINAIEPGQKETVISSSWKATEGVHRVILCVDEPNPVIPELLETNNCSLGGTGIFSVSTSTSQAAPPSQQAP